MSPRTVTQTIREHLRLRCVCTLWQRTYMFTYMFTCSRCVYSSEIRPDEGEKWWIGESDKASPDLRCRGEVGTWCWESWVGPEQPPPPPLCASSSVSCHPQKRCRDQSFKNTDRSTPGHFHCFIPAIGRKQVQPTGKRERTVHSIIFWYFTIHS